LGLLKLLSRYEYLSGASIQILIDALDNKNNEYDDNHRMRVIVALHELTTLYRKKLPGEALRALKDVLANQSDTVQFNAAVILNDQKVPLPSTGIQIMMDVVKNKNEEWTEFRGTAIRILGNQEALPPQAFFLFEDALADQDDEVQLSAALALTDQKVPLPSTSIQMLLEVVKK
jgi:HEAT repeat protein